MQKPEIQENKERNTNVMRQDVCQSSICFPSIERHRDLAAAAIRYRESVFIIAIIITSSGDNNINPIIVCNGNKQINLQRGLFSLHP